MSSKRKNPLLNLNDFLKKEASSFVTPKNLKDSSSPAATAANAPHISSKKTNEEKEITIETILEDVKQLAQKNNQNIRELVADIYVRLATESGLESSKDKMLINTLLYIQNEEKWQEKIKEFWSKQIN